MNRLEELIRHEQANSAVAFRERAYLAREHAALLRDVIAMANAPVSGPRFIVMGVREQPGAEREITGLAPETIAAMQETYRSIVAAYAEPEIDLVLRYARLDGATVGVLVIDSCDDAPYLIARDLSRAIRRGAGWIRRGTHVSRIGRAELQRMFALASGSEPACLRVAFAGGDGDRQLLSLPVLPLDRLPSEVAGDRLRQLLEARQLARGVLGRDDTSLNRLTHVRLYGDAVPYETHSDDSLVTEFEKAAPDHAAADRFYALEQRSHKLNLILSNTGESDLGAIELVLDIPRIDGVTVAQQIEVPPGGAPPPDGYPSVAALATTYQVTAGMDLPSGTSRAAFRQPLRLMLREPAAGSTLRLCYRARRGASELTRGTLQIGVCAADANAAAAERESPAAGA